MRNRTFLGAMVGLLAMLVLADSAFGQRRAGARATVRAGAFNNWNTGGWYPGQYTGFNWAYPFSGNQPFTGANWYGNNWYGNNLYGNNWGNYGWPGYSSNYSPWSGGNSYYPGGGYYSGGGYAMPSTEYAQPQMDSFYASTDPAKLVHLRVHVMDPNARITVQDQTMPTMGNSRIFVSPPLEQGSTYVYTVKATWNENGQQRSETQKIDVQPGSNYELFFPKQARQQRMPEPPPSNRIRTDARDDDRDFNGARAATIQGAFVRAADGRLIITTDAGQERTLTLGDNVQVMMDGRAVQLNELRQGAQLSIQTSGSGDAATVTRIEAAAKVNPKK